MQNYLSTPLDYDERLELIPALVDIARMYYDGNRINIYSGICYQLATTVNVRSAYGKMIRLMAEIGYTDQNSYFEGPEPISFESHEDWEPRAIMCLFLSEYLFSTLDQYSEDVEIDEIKNKSFLQKVKDKFNSFVESIEAFHKAKAALHQKVLETNHA